jgi:serine/threonine protein kinase
MPEPEMWYILRAVAGGSKSLKSHGLFHGDIQPRHVLIDPEGGVKLVEAPLINQYFTGYNRMAFEADYHAALSPEQLAVLANRKPDVAADYTEKDEVYAAGITALCSATNNPITEYYDYTNYTVKNDAINNSLQQMGSLGYSNELVQTIGKMLNQDPSSRATLDQVDTIANKPHDVVEEYQVAPNFPVAAKNANVRLIYLIIIKLLGRGCRSIQTSRENRDSPASYLESYF